MKQLISSSIKITSRHGTCFADACQSQWIKTTVQEMEDISIGFSIYPFYVQSRLKLRQRSCTYFFLIWVWNLLAKQLVRLLFQLTNEALYLYSFWYTCTSYKWCWFLGLWAFGFHVRRFGAITSSKELESNSLHQVIVLGWSCPTTMPLMSLRPTGTKMHKYILAQVALLKVVWGLGLCTPHEQSEKKHARWLSD